MGCLFVITLGGLSTVVTYFLGYTTWVLTILVILWFAALVTSAIWGHRGFGGRGNTDLTIVAAGVVIAVVLIIPQLNARRPCNQARAALRNLADAEQKYYSGHNSFTTDLVSLGLTRNPDIIVVIAKGDEHSCVALVSHRLCSKDKNGAPQIFAWDSARGEPK